MASKKDSSSIVVGDWVYRRANSIDGIGPYQVVEVSKDQVTMVSNAHPIEIFDRTLKVGRKEVQKLDDVSGISLWFPRNNHKAWEHGRALAGGEDAWQIEIDSTDGIHSHKFRNDFLKDNKKGLWVKDFRSVPEPIEMLRLGMSTRIKELNVARRFRKWINEQVHASVGFSAIMAAPVRPAHHQLNAMARVLGDPTLRFLLADEVGLGKTIEASLVLKQLFLDGAISNAVIAVPRALKAQWKRELNTKLSLGHWIEGGQIEIIAHEDVSIDLSPDILIVDEAHRFCRGERSESHFSILKMASQKVTRLLLISATPMRSDPYMLLQLLHLIDARNYRLDEEEVFRKRLAMRVRQSNALRLLKPTTSEDQRAYFVQTLRENMPEDFTISVLLATVENAESNTIQLSTAIETLRTEIEERFRISRRLVRNRRSAIDQEDFYLSGRSYEFIEFTPDKSDLLNEFLENWRSRSQGTDWSIAEPVFVSLLEHVLGGVLSTQVWINHRLGQLEIPGNRFHPIFETEKNLLEQYRILIPTSDECSPFFSKYFEPALTRQVQAGVTLQKTVLCSGYTEHAKTIYEALHKRFGTRVVGHFESQSDEENDISIQKFTSVEDVSVLVIDGSAEEGLNLQAARTLINIDLPWSVNRLEQRIGRLDRFSDGHAQDAVCKVLVDNENELLAKYVQFLNDATGIFNESVATAQQSLAQVLRELANEIWKSGVRDTNLNLDEVRARISHEKEEVEELEDIESESSFGDFPEVSFRKLQLFEEQWGESQKVINKITDSDGGIGIRRTPVVNDSPIYRYSLSRSVESRIPDFFSRTAAENLSSRATFSRPVALNHPGTEMLRIGNRMIKYFDDFLYRDDIGRVSVGWVKDNEMSSPYIDFSVEILVTPDFEFLKELIPASDFKRVQRRIGTSLQPQLLELRVDENANPISAENPVWGSETRRTLGEDLVTVIGRRGSFAEALDNLEEKLPSLVEELLSEQINEALESAKNDANRRINSLKVWQSGNVRGEIELEEQIAEELDHGLRNPQIKVLSIVAVVHSYEEFS
jgi:superfamily II DNA or RNA helicase